MIHHAVAEHGFPGIGEGPESRRHMRADRLAFGSRRAFAAAPIQLRQHLLIVDRRRIDVADPLLGHVASPVLSMMSLSTTTPHCAALVAGRQPPDARLTRK